MNKLFLIFTEYPPKFGGMQTHALNMSLILSKYYNITVFTYKNTNLLNEAGEFDRNMDFDIKRVLSRISFFSNIKILTKSIKIQKPDLIYSSTVFYGILKQYVSIPVVCRSVGNDMLRPWIIYPFRFGTNWVNNIALERIFNSVKKSIKKPPLLDIIFVKQRKKLAEKAAKKADLILCNSNFTQQIFNSSNINNSRVLIGGVDVNHYSKPKDFDKNNVREKLGISPNNFVIMTSGRFVQKKGIDFLIDAFMLLEKEFDNIELVIIGEGAMKKELENQAKESEKIHFMGRKTQAEIKEYYWISDLYVLSSRMVINKKTGFKDVETMGRVLCEANAASVPVIASNSGGVSSIIEHKVNGLLYETDNYESFKKCFYSIYKNNKLVDKMLVAGLDKAQNVFDWSVLATKHINFFSSFGVKPFFSDLNTQE